MPSPAASQNLAIDPDAERLPILEIATLTVVRIVFNVAFRMVYPFLPAISRGLGISTDTGRLLISARSAAGLTSPLVASLSDRYGRRTMALGALFVFALAMIAIPIVPVFTVALGAFAVLGFAKVIFDSAALAYVGDRVPYERRGLAMGLNELGWSGGLFIGAPLVGLSIWLFGWSSPFVGIAVFAALGFVLILLLIPSDRNVAREHSKGRASGWSLLLKKPVALGTIGFVFLLGLANESIFSVYGEWMEGSFGLEIAALGLVTAIIGGADLVGELMVAGISDRFGKRRMVLLGLIGAALGYAGLPWIGPLGLLPALIVMFVMFFSFEVSLVASLPIISEVLPQARGTMMAATIAASSFGRMLGAPGGGWLWNIGGFRLTGLAAALINVVALLVALAVLRDEPVLAVETTDAAA